MGTRSLTIIKDNEGKKDLLTIYRQFDGYLSGHGKDLKDFLTSRLLVNGYNRSDKGVIEANGMGCLAAQLIATLKTSRRVEGKDTNDIGPGNVYIEPNGTHDVGEEYLYIIAPIRLQSARMGAGSNRDAEAGGFNLKIYTLGEDYKKGCTRLVFSGPVKDFDPEMEK